MVELGRVSRSGFYRFDESARPDRDMDLRDAIQRIALEWPSYGRPRITAELRRRGWTVNAKRVHRLLREDNLLCVRKRKFVVTTDSNHGRKVYPNLARDLVLTGMDQLWRGDITYIPSARRVRLLSGDPGRLLTPGDRLGSGSQHGGRVDADRAPNGSITA
jgi:putative transposase